MTAFIEVRRDTPVQVDGKTFTLEARPTGGLVQRHSQARSSWGQHLDFGGFIADTWEIMAPYVADPFGSVVDPDVVAVLVKRDERYRTALKARGYIKDNDLHEDVGPVSIRAHFRSMGGTVIQPGGLSDRDVERFPGRTARIHGPGDITLFLQEGESELLRRELMALTIASQALLSLEGAYEEGYHRGALDLALGNSRWDHKEAHFFAAMLLVPQVEAARAVDIPAAEEVGRELKVDPATVQDAHQLWDTITNPALPQE